MGILSGIKKTAGAVAGAVGNAVTAPFKPDPVEYAVRLNVYDKNSTNPQEASQPADEEKKQGILSKIGEKIGDAGKTVAKHALATAGTGSFHSGVELSPIAQGAKIQSAIDTVEIAYGGDDWGVWKQDPKILPSKDGVPAVKAAYKNSLEMGTAKYTKEDIEYIIADFEKRWLAKDYNSAKRNANHFSEELVEALLGEVCDFPWLNKKANAGAKVGNTFFKIGRVLGLAHTSADNVRALLSKDQVKAIEARFTMADADKSGEVDVTELSVMMRMLNQNPTEAELIKMIAAFDADHNGKLNSEEFLVLMGNRILTAKDPITGLEEAFKVFDRDNSGTISKKELAHVLKHIGEEPRLTDEEIEKIMTRADSNGDGQIDIHEFAVMMNKPFR